MSSPVKLSDELVRAARATAAAADRSIAGQVEHWAGLGRAVEAYLRTSEALALKSSRGELDNAVLGEASRRSINHAVRRTMARALSSSAPRASAGSPLYASDPATPGLLVRIDPNGRRTPGRLIKDRLRPVSTRRR